jgi:hypothetical protein
MRSIDLHYTSGIIPGLVISTLFAVKYILWLLQKIRFTKRYASAVIYILTAILLIVAVRVNYGYGPLPISQSCWCVMYHVSSQDVAFDKILQTIPQDATVTASPEIRSHITHRENAYTLPDATSSAQFIAIIDQNRLVGNYSPKTFELGLVSVLQKNKKFTLVSHINHFYLYKKRNI